ncbi:MAG: hypothetical protein AAGJ87_12120 [Pseudomonadota bacterium]
MFGQLSVRKLFIAAGLALVAGCATVTPYGPAGKSGQGYADQKLESDKFRVTFEGNSSTDRATIENYVLFRSAEITLENGFDYFVVLDQTTESLSRFNTTGTTFGGGGFGRRGFFYGGGFGGFGNTTATTRERRKYITGAVIQTYRGDKPSNNPSAYDARQIIDNLRPVMAFDAG